MTIFCAGIKLDTQGLYEVHTLDCPLLPDVYTEIGMFDNTKDALNYANSIWPTVHACQICTPRKKKKIWDI